MRSLLQCKVPLPLNIVLLFIIKCRYDYSVHEFRFAPYDMLHLVYSKSEIFALLQFTQTKNQKMGLMKSLVLETFCLLYYTIYMNITYIEPQKNMLPWPSNVKNSIFYEGSNGLDDIALIKLQEDVTFVKGKISPICLPPKYSQWVSVNLPRNSWTEIILTVKLFVVQALFLHSIAF